MADKSKIIEPGYGNALYNAVKPYTMGGKTIMGAATYVGIETIVGQTIRRIMRAPYNIAESVEIHAYSVPFLGQVNFGDDFKPYNVDSKAKFEVMDEVTEGAKAIPAAVVGYTAAHLRRNGLKIPTFANRDFFYLLVGKLLSRPLTAFVFSSLPEDFQAGLHVLTELANRQKTVIESAKEKAEDL